MRADRAAQDHGRRIRQQRQQGLDEEERALEVDAHEPVVSGFVPILQRAVGYVASVRIQHIEARPLLRNPSRQRALTGDVAGIALERQPESPSSRPAADRAASLRPVIATVAPSAKNWRAVSRPMPLVPPVISAYLS